MERRLSLRGAYSKARRLAGLDPILFHLESPEADRVASSGPVAFGGWAVSRERRPLHLSVEIDAGAPFTVPLDIVRQDVMEVIGDANPRVDAACGFAFVIDMREYKGGARVQLAFSDGVRTVRSGSYDLRYSAPAHTYDRAPAGPPAPPVPTFAPGDPADFRRTRAIVAAAFLAGDGIEIGALHQPLTVPSAARVRFVDRRTKPELGEQYPSLTDPIVDVDVVDDGEALTTFADASQDFIIANHFIEHCQNPIQTLQTFFRVLRPGGVVYLAVPDKRFTFDVDRPATTIDHVIRDFEEGPGWSERGHFEEWARLVSRRTETSEVEREVEDLVGLDYSIHFHVWAAKDLLELLVALGRVLTFELEIFLRNGFETIVVFRKPDLRGC